MADTDPLDAPPLPARLKYYLLDLVPDERHRAWVERDLSSSLWIFRPLVPVAVGYLIGGTLASVLLPWDSAGFFVGSLIGLVVATPLLAVIPRWRRWMRRRRLDSYEKRWAKQSGRLER